MMAITKKCDRCGAYFEDVKHNANEGQNCMWTGRRRIEYGEHVTEIHCDAQYRNIDLCPCCMTSLLKWIDVGHDNRGPLIYFKQVDWTENNWNLLCKVFFDDPDCGAEMFTVPTHTDNSEIVLNGDKWFLSGGERCDI